MESLSHGEDAAQIPMTAPANSGNIRKYEMYKIKENLMIYLKLKIVN